MAGAQYKTGDRIGAYEIEALLGAGGQGHVYRAKNVHNGRQVALKHVSPAVHDANDADARFRREVAIAAHLAHPNVIKAGDAFEHDGKLWLPMPYLGDRSLRTWIQGGDRAEWRAIALGVAQGVAYLHRFAHERVPYVAHRDIKPENILLDKDSGRPVLVDFGLARRPHDHTDMRAQGASKYAPPEVTEGRMPDGAGKDDEDERKWDVYSLGLVLYELTTGRLPELSVRSSPTLWADATAGVAEWSPPLRKVIGGCGARLPRERPTADEIVAALEAVPAAHASDSTVGPPRARRQAMRAASTRARTDSPQVRDATTSETPAVIPRVGGVAGALVSGGGWVGLLAIGLWFLMTSHPGALGCEVPELRDGGVADAEPSARDAEPADAHVPDAHTPDARVARDARPPDATPPPPPPAPAYEYVWSASARVALGRTEVTTAQYTACVRAKSCTAANTGGYCNARVQGRAQHPINCIDAGQAQKVCEFLDDGRLPTEEEWFAEASARGDHPWGASPPSCANTVMQDASTNLTCGGADGTREVCTKPEGNSVSGLCDLVGNVWEWTATKSGGRVARGGSWLALSPEFLRASARYEDVAALQYDGVGVRCARARPSSP